MNPSERIDQLIAKLTDWRGKNARQHPQEHPCGRPGDNRGMEVDGKPGVVSRWNDRGRQRPQGEGEAYLFPRGEALGSGQALQRGASKATRGERSIFSRVISSMSVL